MNMDKKTILAFLLIGVVFLFVQSPLYQKYFFPDSYKKQGERKSGQITKTDALGASPAIDQPVGSEAISVLAEDATRSVLDPKDDTPAREIRVDTKLYTAIFSTRGGTLVSWTLKSYKKADGSLVSMLPSNSTGNLGIDFITREEGDTVHTGNWVFEANSTGDLVLNNDTRTLRFIHRIDDKHSVSKTFSFREGYYDFELEIALENFGSLVADKSYQLLAPNGLATTEKRLSEDMYYAKAVIAAAGRINKYDKAKGILQKENGSIDWVAVRTKYFAYAIIPKTQKAEYATVLGHEIARPEFGKDKLKQFGVGLGMPLTRESSKDRFTIFIGPMHDDLLKSYQVSLEKMMDMGAKIIQPFSIATLWTFKKIHSVIPNYGFVLIIFALLIKIITAPLTHKSYQSMKKMQALQPKMTELKEKYAKDPQRLNAETMKLYKEEGVNPMGGCLPILLQMPLLWALYIVFRSTISLRHEGFFWWIKDLSGPDTIYTLPFSIPMYGDSVNVLPILMGLTMILQQKMTVTDPKQKAMIYIMPIFMTLLFNNFPSGLNLYYTLFNVISIVHQQYFMGDSAKSLIPSFAKRK